MYISESKKTAIVIGATGLIGRHLVSLLLDSTIYSQVTTIVRRKGDQDHPKLKEVVIDFDHLVDQAYDHMASDDIFIALGTTIKDAGSKDNFYRVDYKYVVLCAEMAHRQGAKVISLVSSSGADSESKVFYARVKGQVEDRICRMPYWAVHIFRPSLLLGKRDDRRLLESTGKLIGRGLVSIFGNKMGRYRPIDAREVAQAMILQAQVLKPGLSVINSDEIHTLAEQWH